MLEQRRAKVLLLGSEPFAGMNCNPAAEVARSLADKSLPTAEVVAVVLPVAYAELPRRIAGLAAEHQPDIAIGLGVFAGAAYVRVETTAINIADFDVADNRGVFIRNTPIDADGPHGRAATYDAEGLATMLRAHGVPSRVSHHAGTHLCNLTLYELAKAGETLGVRPLVGFLHLPLLPEQAASLTEEEARHDHASLRVQLEYPSMDLRLQVAAVELVIAELCAARKRTAVKREDLLAVGQRQ